MQYNTLTTESRGEHCPVNLDSKWVSVEWDRVSFSWWKYNNSSLLLRVYSGLWEHWWTVDRRSGFIWEIYKCSNKKRGNSYKALFKIKWHRALHGWMKIKTFNDWNTANNSHNKDELSLKIRWTEVKNDNNDKLEYFIPWQHISFFPHFLEKCHMATCVLS